tara:strand:- start:78 stop:962 length:885 start_codon:yes stop_codon:yes gene_type:complete
MIDKRMTYAQGQRVAKSLNGKRPGYRGSDYGDQARSTGAYSGSTGSNTPGPGDTGSQGGGNQDNTGSSSTVDKSSALQTYNTKKATGTLGRQDGNQMDSTVFYGKPTMFNPNGMIDIGYQGPLNASETRGQNFLKTQPTYNKYVPPSLKVLGNLNNKPNRNYFYNTVIRGGKIPGLNHATVDLEKAYQDYMDNRMAGKTDAAGNPTEGFSYGDDGLTGNFINDSDDSQNSGIMTVANNPNDDPTDDPTDDTTTEDELLLRFLGADSTLDPAAAGVANTDELRAMILERARNLYT